MGEGREANLKLGLYWLIAAAQAGDAQAAFKLGEMHASGDGVKRDPVDALGWFEFAANHGHAEASFRLGSLYHVGKDVPPDAARALGHYLDASARGHAAATLNAAFMFDKGEGAAENKVRAKSLYVQAAQAGLGQACYNLAANTGSAKTAQADLVEVLMWLELAVQAPTFNPQIRELARANRDSFARVLSPGQVDQARQRARDWALQYWQR